MLSGIVIGAFAMFIYHLAELKSTTPSAVQTTEKSKPTEAAPAKAPAFEFYDRLKQEQVEVPDYDTSEAHLSAQQTHEYFLQVASFRRQSDADKLRANLILLNLNANIEKSSLASGATAFRVITGPFPTKSKVAKAQQLLVSSGYDYLKIKRKIER